MRSLTTSCWPYTVIERPVRSTKSMRWRRPSNASWTPRWLRPSRSRRSASPRPAQQLDGRVLEHAGADAVLDVLAVALLEHDAVDAPRGQQVGQHEPGGSGADDRHLGLVNHDRDHDAAGTTAVTAPGDAAGGPWRDGCGPERRTR